MIATSQSLEQRFRDPGSYLVALAPSGVCFWRWRVYLHPAGVRKREGEEPCLGGDYGLGLEAEHIPWDAYPLSSMHGYI